jgi:hypothetical protein
MSTALKPAHRSLATLVAEHSVRTGPGQLDRTGFQIEVTRTRGKRSLEVSCSLTRLRGEGNSPSAEFEDFTATLSGRDELAGLVDALSKVLLACDAEREADAA